MPAKTKKELPKGVKGALPDKAQEIYRKAYNKAYDEYGDTSRRRGSASREETASKVAWSAVKGNTRRAMTANGIRRGRTVVDPGNVGTHPFTHRQAEYPL